VGGGGGGGLLRLLGSQLCGRELFAQRGRLLPRPCGRGSHLVVRWHSCPGAYDTARWVMTYSRAVLPPKVDDLEMRIPPRTLRQQGLEICLCLLHTVPIRQPPPLCKPTNHQARVMIQRCQTPCMPPSAPRSARFGSTHCCTNLQPHCTECKGQLVSYDHCILYVPHCACLTAPLLRASLSRKGTM